MPGRVRCDAQSERLRHLLRAPLIWLCTAFPDAAAPRKALRFKGLQGPYFLPNAMGKLTLPGGRRCRPGCAPLQ
jgi:hypothetical protein